jgi:hypothetical protein
MPRQKQPIPPDEETIAVLIANLQKHEDEIYQLRLLATALTGLLRETWVRDGTPAPKFDERVQQEIAQSAKVIAPKEDIEEATREALQLLKNPPQLN